MKKPFEIYGIIPGQVYARADGGPGRVVVRDVETYADVGDVVVWDELSKTERRVDAFKLAKVRYYLVDFSEGEQRRELLTALRAGVASADQQRKASELFYAMISAMAEQREDVRRGKYVVEVGEWRCHEDPRDGKRTWLSVPVEPNADLSCKGTRAKALDVMIEKADVEDAKYR